MAPRLRSLVVLPVAVALLATACGAGEPRHTPPGGASTADDLIEIDQVASTERENGPSALDDPTADGLPAPTIDLDRLVSGGPPPDGIPAIDRPLFHSAGDVTFLDDREPVVAIEVDGDARAYPVQILTWHEIVNDTVGGEPIAISYCPLCNSAIAYDRRLGDRVLDFGTSGLLFNSALVMYDRQTESLWSHFTAEAVAGVLTGEELDRRPTALVAWSEWRSANPDGLVLSRSTGHQRDYGHNPYTGYDDIDQPPFLFDGEADGRLRAMTRMVGINDGDDAVAVQLDALLDAGVLEASLAGRDLVVWALRGTASALDDSNISDGRDVGTTGVFEAELDGRQLRFERVDEGFVDEQTGSLWNVLGEAVEGELTGRQLTRVSHVDTFWFAWAAFLPDTEIVPPLE
ncbi:MAG TPA: DUF3179 domain-containing protein [Acidimicrobiales bacterium]|nr:DUF3179 domain-containing protein [Acidimicrobiales bacterium]